MLGRGPRLAAGWTASVLVLLALVLALGAAPASAKRVSVSAVKLRGTTAVFRVSGIKPVEVRGATLRVGSYRKLISQTRMLSAARRHRLRLRLPRRVVKRLRRHGARLSRRSRRWPRLSVSVLTGAVWEARMSFETGNFSEASSLQAREGDLRVITSRAYDGRRSVRARWLGGSHGAQRVWKDTDWSTGSNVWYGMAVFVPLSTDYCYWNPLRWDNYSVYEGDGDVGGLTVEQNQIKLMRGTYADDDEDTIVHGGPLPKGRWVWLEVHQKFSPHHGQALNELYVDGVRKGYSTAANTYGRRITDLRAGAVAVADECSSPNAIDFDRVTISNRRRGPL